MSIEVTSNTKPPTTTASDSVSGKVVDEKKPASAEKQDEIVASDSETDEVEVETEAKEDDGEEGDQGDQSKDDKPKKKSGIQRRFAKLTSRATQAEQRAVHAEQRAAYIEAELQKIRATDPKDKKVASTEKSEGEPNPDDFESHAEYVKAVTKWTYQEEKKASDAETRTAKIKADHENVTKSFADKVEAYKKDHADFDELIESVNDIPMSIAVSDILLRSPNGPELMHALAKNPDEYERICGLSAQDAAFELGAIKASLKKPESQIEKKTTSAPRPIKTLGSSSSGAGKKDLFDPSLTQAEYEQLRREQMKKRA